MVRRSAKPPEHTEIAAAERTFKVSIMISRTREIDVGSGESYTLSRSSSGVVAHIEVAVSRSIRGTCATDFWHVSIIDSSLEISASATARRGLITARFYLAPRPSFPCYFLREVTKLVTSLPRAKRGLLSAAKIINESIKLCDLVLLHLRF